jgi:hypothetical protein
MRRYQLVFCRLDPLGGVQVGTECDPSHIILGRVMGAVRRSWCSSVHLTSTYATSASACWTSLRLPGCAPSAALAGSSRSPQVCLVQGPRQRQLLGAAAGRQGRHRTEALDNCFAAVDDPGRVAADLQPVGAEADRRTAALRAGQAAAPAQRCRLGSRLPRAPRATTS